MDTGQVFIMRGLPGSGKNTWAEDKGIAHIIDSDSYHVNEEGEYDFDPDQATAAHTFCFRKFLRILPELGDERVAVCNTNTLRAEFTPYVMAARAFGLRGEVRLVHCKCSIETAVERNIHEVPREVIEKMDERWEEPESFDPTEITIHTD